MGYHPGPKLQSPQLTEPFRDENQLPRRQAGHPRLDEVFHSYSCHGVDTGGRCAVDGGEASLRTDTAQAAWAQATAHTGQSWGSSPVWGHPPELTDRARTWHPPGDGGQLVRTRAQSH